MTDQNTRKFISSDIVTQTEAEFPFKQLLNLVYFKKYRYGYYRAREVGLLNKCRNYVSLLTYLAEIFDYNKQHAKSFAKRFRDARNDWRNSEAIFSEIIVYRSYIRGIYEGFIKNIELNQSESDIILVRPDGSKMFLEVFCVMPNFRRSKEHPGVFDVKTHTQTDSESIRQKLLRKIAKQKQFSKPRENYAIVELNDPTIAGDFAVLSSLSGGYTMEVGTANQVLSQGYNWDRSVFNDSQTRFLKAVIYFSLGHYESRKFLFNPRFRMTLQ
jgi:hypothetical protein